MSFYHVRLFLLVIRQREPFSESREDFSAAGGEDLQRDTGQCQEVHPHSDQDPLSSQPSELPSEPLKSTTD
jgi:hypothetical protein